MVNIFYSIVSSSFVNLDTKMSFDGWKIQCPDEMDRECGASH